MSRETTDLKRLWQAQPEEENPMTLELLLQQARSVGARTRKQMLFPFVLTLAATILGTVRFLDSSSFWLWILIATMLWGWTIRKAYAAYRIHRWMRPVDDAAEVALRDSIAFYRLELEREYRQAVQRVRPSVIALTLVLVSVVVTAIVLTGSGTLVNLVPILVLLGAWIGASFYRRRHETRRVERELAELDRFEEETRV